jgi:hypothetical protein
MSAEPACHSEEHRDEESIFSECLSASKKEQADPSDPPQDDTKKTAQAL